MPYVLGVDIGGSFTTAAIAHYGEGARQPASRPLKLGHDGNAVPSIVFVDDDAGVVVGEEAEHEGIWRPDRVLREFRQRMGDPVPIAVGELHVLPEEVYAMFVRWVVDRAEENVGERPESVTLTVPAHWGDYRLELARGALANVGLTGVDLLAEPVAAAVGFAHRHPGAEGPVAVYDLGGTSFDVCIVTSDGAAGFDILGEPGHCEHLGGASFDELVFRRLALRIGDTFTKHTPASDEVRDAFSVVRREAVRAKEALSFRAETSVPVVLPGLRATVRLVRPEFEAMIDDSIRETVGTFRRTLNSAGLQADDLAAVFLIGGSSCIPFVARHLSTEVDRPVVVDTDPTAAVALGAALSGALAHAAAMPEPEPAKTQDLASYGSAPPDKAPGKGRNRRPIIASRLRQAGRSVSAGPVAVAAMVAGLVLTVVLAQATGLSALVSEVGDRQTGQTGQTGGDRYTPEVLREDGPALGFPFGLQTTVSDKSDPTPDFSVPPGADNTVPSPEPEGSGARRGDGQGRTQAQQESQKTKTPGPGTSSTVPVPDPDPQPAPGPEPVPDPEPEPVPVPDPNPEPDVPPDPTPDVPPDTTPQPDPDPIPADPTPETPVVPGDV